MLRNTQKPIINESTTIIARVPNMRFRHRAILADGDFAMSNTNPTII